jgi:hypothetical protein
MAKPRYYTFVAATVIVLFVLNHYVFQMSKDLQPSSQREEDVSLTVSTLLSSKSSRLDEGPKKFVRREVMVKRAKLKSCPNVKHNSSHPQFVNSIRLVNGFSCADILLHVNDTNKRTRVRTKHPVEDLSSVSYHEDEYYLDAARRCNTFKLQLGYRTSLMEGDDPDFPIAFNILTHQSLAQVERLLRAIYRPHNSYCIHVDAKANETFQRALRAVVSCFDNVFIASKLEAIVYAGYSRLQADINCMKDHLTSPIKWRYLINTASNAYPLKTNAEITKILKIYNGANDVKATAYGWYFPLKIRWMYKFIEPDVAQGDPDGEVIRTQQRLPPPPHNLTIVKGSAYAVFSRGFIDYIVNDKVAQDYLRFCRDTYSPDEHYWNTLHHTYHNPHIHPPGSFSGILLFKYLFFS